jgi:putative membrane protein
VTDPIEAEPDYRFTLANERTYLAWIRTALALIAGGVLLVQLTAPELRYALGLGLVGCGGVLAVLALRRWRRVQRAMRRNADLPPSSMPAVLVWMLLVIAAALMALVIAFPQHLTR